MHWILLAGEKKSGVTLQTLHPKVFDAGKILDQTPGHGIDIPNPDSILYDELEELVAPMVADMLVKCIRRRSFTPPREDMRADVGTRGLHVPSFAPKIERNLRFVDFQRMKTQHILRMNRAIPPLWAEATDEREAKSIPVIFSPELHSASQSKSNLMTDIDLSIPYGLPYAVLGEKDHVPTSKAPLMINTLDGGTVVVPSIKISGTGFRPAAGLSWGSGMLDRKPRISQGKSLYTLFHRLKTSDNLGLDLDKVWLNPDRNLPQNLLIT